MDNARCIHGMGPLAYGPSAHLRFTGSQETHEAEHFISKLYESHPGFLSETQFLTEYRLLFMRQLTNLHFQSAAKRNHLKPKSVCDFRELCRVFLANGGIAVISQQHHGLLRQESETPQQCLFLGIHLQRTQRLPPFQMLLASYKQIIFLVFATLFFQAFNTLLNNNKIGDLQFILQGLDIPCGIYAAKGVYHIFVFEGTHHMYQSISIF